MPIMTFPFSHPRFRQDVAFLETPDGILVKSPDAWYTMRGSHAYRLLSLLLPHLDGQTPLAESVAGLPEAQVNAILTMLDKFRLRGVVIEGVGASIDKQRLETATFASQRTLLGDLGDDGMGFNRVLDSAVAVVGSDPVLCERLRCSLSSNGVGAGDPDAVTLLSPSEATIEALDSVDLVVIVEVAGPQPYLFDLLNSALGRADVVSVFRVGDQVVVGPWQPKEGPSSVASMFLRMTDNGVPGAGDYWATAVAGAGAAMAQQALPHMAGEIAVSCVAFEVFKVLGGVSALDLANGILRLDAQTLEIAREPVVLHPLLCPSGQLELPPVATSGVDMSEAEREFSRFTPVVGELAGIVRGFDDDSVDQLPVKVAVLKAPSTGTPVSIGFGLDTLLDSRLGAMHRAAARYAVAMNRRHDLLIESPPGDEVSFEKLSTWMGVAPDIGPSTPAWDRFASTEVSVSKAAVLAGPWDRSAAVFEPDLVGVASAPTAEKAAFISLVDAVGGDIKRRVEAGSLILNEVSAQWISAHADDDALSRIKLLMSAVASVQLAVRVYTCDAAVPFVVVVGGGGQTAEAACCSAEAWTTAFERALLEVVGPRQLLGTAYAGAHQGQLGPVDLSGVRVGPAAVASDFVSLVTDDRAILRALDEQGRRALSVDLTPGDLRGVTEVVRTILTSQSAC